VLVVVLVCSSACHGRCRYRGLWPNDPTPDCICPLADVSFSLSSSPRTRGAISVLLLVPFQSLPVRLTHNGSFN